MAAARLGHRWTRSHLCPTSITEPLSHYASTNSVQSIFSPWVCRLEHAPFSPLGVRGQTSSLLTTSRLRSPKNIHQQHHPHRQNLPLADQSPPRNHPSIPQRPRLPRLRNQHAHRTLRIPNTRIPPAPLPYHLPSSRRLLLRRRRCIRKPNHHRKTPPRSTHKPIRNPSNHQPQHRRRFPNAPPLTGRQRQ